MRKEMPRSDLATFAPRRLFVAARLSGELAGTRASIGPMQTLPYVVLVILAGAAIAFQSPINAGLGRVVGPFNSAFVSFAVGVVVSFIAASLTDGLGRLQGITSAQPWQFLGGILGVMLVTALIIAVPRIGVSQMMVAALAGQLAAAMLIDHYGWLGVEARSFGWKRGIAIPLLGVAVWLIRQPS